MNGYFITGTDTGVGKTAITAALCYLLRGREINAVPVKPVQTGVAAGEPGDLEHCLAVCGLKPNADELALMNPYRFRIPASPHLAAETEHTAIDLDHLQRCCQQLSGKHELLLVEGAGGLLVPLTRKDSTLDLAVRLGLPLLVVARAGLGTLNHSLLTLRVAHQAGLNVAALILNHTGPEPGSKNDRLIVADNARLIAQAGAVQVIGPLPYLPGAGREVAATRKLAVQLGNIPESDSITL